MGSSMYVRERKKMLMFQCNALQCSVVSSVLTENGTGVLKKCLHSVDPSIMPFEQTLSEQQMMFL